jgi:hypothetical protein
MRFSDVKTQERMLRNQLIHMGPAILDKALKHMYKRVTRFYGLNNKYHSNGQLRLR